MDLIRRNKDVWDPFDVFSDLQNEMNRVFNRSLKKQDGWPQNFNPDVEVTDETDHYTVHADLPGLKKEDFDISVRGNQVTIKGERKKEHEKKEKNAYFTERLYGSFSRTLEFPTELAAEKVKAAYKDGVLEVTLPKSETSKPKQINVEVK